MKYKKTFNILRLYLTVSDNFQWIKHINMYGHAE